MGEPTAADMEKAQEMADLFIGLDREGFAKALLDIRSGVTIEFEEARAEGHAAGRAEMAGEVRELVQAEVDECNKLGLENPEYAFTHHEQADAFDELLAKIPGAPIPDGHQTTKETD